MPRLVDTTIRVLSQEPLAGLMPTADLLRLAELLDGAGFAYLEVSGGGVFDSAVRRGVESPWERIRALEGPHRDTARAGAPRPLPRRLAPGRRRLRPPLRRERGGERDRGLPPARPAERRRQPARGRPRRSSPRAASSRRGCSTAAAGDEALVDAAKRLPELGAARILAQRSRRAPAAAPRERARRRAPRRLGSAGRPLRAGRGRQRAGRGDRGVACRRRPDRDRRLSRRADDAPRLGRVGGAGAGRRRPRHGRRPRSPLGGVRSRRRAHRRRAGVAARTAGRRARRAVQAARRPRRGARHAAARRRRPAAGSTRCSTR